MESEIKTLRWLAFMTAVGIVTAALILVIDFKLKNDIVGVLQSAEKGTNLGRGGWSYSDPGSGSLSNVRFAPGMEARSAQVVSEEPLFEDSEDSDELDRGAGSEELPASDE